jgi:transposase
MRLYIGIDWSQNKHDLCFLNQAGASLAQISIPHSQEGFWQIETIRQKLGIEVADCYIGLETAHTILVDFLWDQRYTQLYILPPNKVKSSRGRFRQSAARNDPSDARLIADILRTDHPRLQAWQPDYPLTRQIRVMIGFVGFLTRRIVALTNRQRTLLLRYYPAAAELFSALNIPIAQHFIRAFSSPQEAARLDLEQFQAFARQHHYTQYRKLPAILAKLHQPYPQADPGIILSCQQEAQVLAAILLEMIASKKTMLREIKALFARHPDREIFASLPGTGEYLQPALLAKFGEDRNRFPSASRVQALAGTCPVTISSGKRKQVRFRKSCDREFRHIVQQWARSSLRDSVWANAYYARIRPHCDSESHAYRCLANRWLAVLWRLWQDRKPYDEAYHLKQRALRSQPRAV